MEEIEKIMNDFDKGCNEIRKQTNVDIEVAKKNDCLDILKEHIKAAALLSYSALLKKTYERLEATLKL